MTLRPVLKLCLRFITQQQEGALHHCPDQLCPSRSPSALSQHLPPSPRLNDECVLFRGIVSFWVMLHGHSSLHTAFDSLFIAFSQDMTF